MPDSKEDCNQGNETMQYNRAWSDALWVNYVGTIVESGSLGIKKPKLRDM